MFRCVFSLNVAFFSSVLIGVLIFFDFFLQLLLFAAVLFGVLLMDWGF